MTIRLLRTPERHYYGILSGAVRPQHVWVETYGDQWSLLCPKDGKAKFILFHEEDKTYEFRWAKEDELCEFIQNCSMTNTIPGARFAVARIKGQWVVGETARWCPGTGNNYEELLLVDGEAKWVEA